MKISVVIVVRNRGEYLSECLQSVLDQSYPAHEIVLVDTLGDDAYIERIISQIDRSRVRRVFHSDNPSRSSAIVEGCRASSGEIVCFLDENDKFKSEKLGEVAGYFGENPQANAVSHACFVISRNGALLSLWRPKERIGLKDLLLRDPPPLSSLAVRRSCVDELASYGEAPALDAEWVGFAAQLLLSGITFSVIDRPLCESRAMDLVTGSDLPNSLKTYTRVLDAIFADPRYPENMLGLRESALARLHLKSAYEAFVRGDSALGRELLRSSVCLDRSILDVHAYRFFHFLILQSIRDGGDHRTRIERVFEQLPAGMMWMTPRRSQVIARGFALRGARAVMWGRREEGESELAEAVGLGCRLDRYFFYALAEELMDCESVSGPGTVDGALRILAPYLEKMSVPALVRWFKGEFFANRAFREFDKGRYSVALRSIQYALSAQPVFIANRGLLVTFLRSLGRLRSQAV